MAHPLFGWYLDRILKDPRIFVDRRTFLKTHARLILGASMALPLVGLRPALAAPEHPHISVVTGRPSEATRLAVELLGGMRRFVARGQKVVIKPNMSFTGTIAEAVATHPEVVREIAAMCREAGASRIRVLDHPLRSVDRCIQDVRAACRQFGEETVQGLNAREFYREVSIPKGASLTKTEVMKDVLDADVLIAVPVAKSHGSTGVSLSMKGMMGLVWNRTVMHWRYDLHQSIVDLCTLLRPALVVVDATRVLTTNGPSGPGRVIFPETVIASADMVAADAYTVKAFPWYGQWLGPEKVAHIRIAHERGLGRMDIANLSVKKVSV